MLKLRNIRNKLITLALIPVLFVCASCFSSIQTETRKTWDKAWQAIAGAEITLDNLNEYYSCFENGAGDELLLYLEFGKAAAVFVNLSDLLEAQTAEDMLALNPVEAENAVYNRTVFMTMYFKAEKSGSDTVDVSMTLIAMAVFEAENEDGEAVELAAPFLAAQSNSDSTKMLPNITAVMRNTGNSYIFTSFNIARPDAG